jgi:CRP-like cAMP-binding protein
MTHAPPPSDARLEGELRALAAFADAPVNATDTFFDGFAEESLVAEQPVYESGATGEGLVILLEGVLRVEDPTLATLTNAGPILVSEPGALLSRSSLLGAWPHRHTVRSAGPARIARLPRTWFEAGLQAGSPIARHLLLYIATVAVEDLSGLNRAIRDLVQLHASPSTEKEC